MFKTTRAQLTLWYVVLLALILIGFSSALYVTLARALYQQMDDAIAQNAHDLVDGLRIKNDQFDYPGGENDITDLDAVRAQGYFIRILGVDGTILSSNATYAPLPVTRCLSCGAQRAAAIPNHFRRQRSISPLHHAR